MDANQIRVKFLDFFAKKDHKIVTSDLLAPRNDTSVLFTSAGMNQFKDQFMGQITDFKRAVSCQKCLRTGDLPNVGKSPTHHTFFEMLGNFSFGDYFKTEAISWAWEFVTEILNLPKDRLWISVHKDDEQAYKIWLDTICISKEKIIKLGDKENFWPSDAPKNGPNGPCGPCSEIFYDWGEKFGCKKSKCSPACDCGRFTEIWNLVFTQYDRKADGKLAPLPSKNIDTGMGLERVASVMQNVRENYQTDLFVPILAVLKEQLKRLGITADDVWMRTKAKTVADHIRAVTVAIGDGIVPSNEQRGYVIRKLIRRSIINLKQAGVEKPFCYKLVHAIALTMEKPYPDILRRHQMIAGIIKKEEEMFWTILKERAPLTKIEFNNLQQKLKGPKQNKKDLINPVAQLAFVQYDTYGVPLEISKEIAQEAGLPSDIDEAFEKEMDMQRERSRSKTQISSEIFAKTIGPLIKELKTEFVGYDYCEYQSIILGILKDNSLVDVAKEHEKVNLILKQTPFYPEAGGQVSDTGTISNESFLADVEEAAQFDDVIVHTVLIKQGVAKKGDLVLADIDRHRRFATAKNHTATHLLQYALRTILGKHVEQSGSYVNWEKLRFDFNHFTQIPKEIIKSIELIVNKEIWANIPVQIDTMNIDEAKRQGALAFFGEKYGQLVRTVSVKNRSKELCGGTHVQATGEIGLFKITAESSIAQGLRRIEAVTGPAAFSLIQDNDETIATLSSFLKITPDKLITAVIKLAGEIKTQEKEIKKLKMSSIPKLAESVIKNSVKIGQINVIYSEIKTAEIDLLRKLCDTIKERLEPVICILVATDCTKPLLVVAASKSLADQGMDSVKIIKQITAASGATSGGGRKELAQAGVQSLENLRQAMAKPIEIIKPFITKLG